MGRYEVAAPVAPPVITLPPSPLRGVPADSRPLSVAARWPAPLLRCRVDTPIRVPAYPPRAVAAGRRDATTTRSLSTTASSARILSLPTCRSTT